MKSEKETLQKERARRMAAGSKWMHLGALLEPLKRIALP